MIHAFIYLLSRSFVNRTRARVQRLKQPKYLVGAVFGIIYLYFYFFQFLFLRSRGTGTKSLGMDPALVSLIGVVVLFLMILAAWVVPHARAALVFSEAEITFLFPSPVSRRALVHFKLLRSQLAILLTVLLLTLITGRIFANSHAWMRVLGWWVILSTINLHFLGASFVRTMLLDRGISNRVRRSVVLASLVIFIGATLLWARESLPVPQGFGLTDWKFYRDYAEQLLATPPLAYLMYPFQLVLAPYLAESPAAFARSMLPALVILVLHYLWVIRSDVAFEEASLAVSRKFADSIAAGQKGASVDYAAKGRRPPFSLKPHGFAPVAFLWKNLIGAQATFRPGMLVIVLIPVVVVAIIAAQTGPRQTALISIVSMMVFMVFTWSLFIGAQFVRCDFRKDLAHMEVLKLYPLRGWEVAAGELLAPLVILTAAQWLLLIAGAALLALGGVPAGFPKVPIVWIAAAFIITPCWNGLTLIIPNAAVLLFPSWFQSRVDAPQGIEVAGQRLLLLFGQMVVFSITVVPAGIAFAIGFVALNMIGAESIAPLVGAASASAVLAGEAALGIWIIGKLFERYDLVSEQ